MENIQELIGYLSKKLYSVSQIYASFESDLKKNKISLMKNKINLANSCLSEQDIDRAYNRLEHIDGNLFRQAMLIMVCSFLEEAMNLIGEAAISDYSAKISKKRKVNWFDKRKRLFEEVGVSFKVIEGECERINDLRIIRNCIVHAGGKIDKYRYSAQVEEAVERLKEMDKHSNMNLIEISADKFLLLGESIIPKAIFASQRIIEQCSKAKFSKASKSSDG